MNYYISRKTKEGYIYSCDKICIVGKISYEFAFNFGIELDDFLYKSYLNGVSQQSIRPWDYIEFSDYSNYLKFGFSEFRNNISLKLSNGSSFWFGSHHNSEKGSKLSWKLELNPNKCLPCDFVYSFLNFLKGRSKVSSVRISQFDMAIDFPLKRSCFYLNKDLRMSTIINDGNNNITEYLSKHNSHGFVKLYNKTAESKLDYDLTRLEITLKEFSVSNVKSVFPSLHVYDKSQISFKEQLPELSDNDSVFVDLLRLNPEYFDKLTYRKRQKFVPYMNYDAPLYKLDVECYIKLLKQIKEVFIECPPIDSVL